MRAEERAKALTAEFDRANGWNDWGTDELEAFLASAIREAEASARNEALEEAADSATKFLVGDPFNGAPLRSPGPHEIAAHIRNLKTQD